jgi:RNA polymerase sigma-70 factor (ECF subfamily)
MEAKNFNKNTERCDFESIYKVYFNQVFSYFYRRTSNKFISLELTQDTFLKVYSNMKQFDYKCPINFWIFKIAHNVFCSNLKRSKLSSLIYKEYKIMQGQKVEKYRSDQEKKVINSQYYDIIAQQLSELPDMMRKCIVFHVFHELTYREISKLLCISVNTVKTHLKEGMKRLRQRFDQVVINSSPNLNDGGCQ